MGRKQEWASREQEKGADAQGHADHVTHHSPRRGRPVWVLMTFHFWFLIPEKCVFTVSSLLFKVS